jgi:hypothetical protein
LVSASEQAGPTRRVPTASQREWREIDAGVPVKIRFNRAVDARGTAAVARQFRVSFWTLELSARQQNLAGKFFGMFWCVDDYA